MDVIYFDLNGTLLHLHREYDELVAESFRSVTGQYRAEWVKEYDAAFAEFFETHTPDPCRQALKTVSRNAGTLAETLLRLEMGMCESPEQAQADLEPLRERYCRGVVSNGVPSCQCQKLRACGLNGCVDAIVTSFDLGTYKPAPEPVEFAEPRLSANPYGMARDRNSDVTGARRQGWSACRYRGGWLHKMPAALGWER